VSDAHARWTDVDHYFAALWVAPDDTLSAAIDASRNAGLPDIAVAPNMGKMLQMLVRMNRTRRVLEIGTLGGYSTIWMARGIAPGGQVITLELNAAHARVARANFRRAGVADIVTLREGPALVSLEQMTHEEGAPFDFIFIDADKANIPHYFMWALELSRAGTVIVVDNVVREGEVANAASTDASVVGVRQFNELVAREPRVSATAVQTVGTKGYDGFAMLLVGMPLATAPLGTPVVT
jgi:predicted O-methyltransferase YrrM